MIASLLGQTQGAPERAANPDPPPLPFPTWSPVDFLVSQLGVSRFYVEYLVWPLIQLAIVFFVVLTIIAYLVYLERKVSALIQARLGPMRVGPWGLLQPLADGIKLLSKEDFVPENADRLVFLAAPVIAVAAALGLMALVPFGAAWATVADVNIALLFILSVSSIGVMGIVLAGWASNSKYALLGAVRSSAQMVSYEVAVGLALIGPLMYAQSLSLQGVVEGQRMLGIPYLFVQPLAFVIYIVGALAETNRAPFDLPESESELVAGFHTEYSGFRWALFFMAEYANIIIVTAIAVTLFLGGWWFPGMEALVEAVAGADMTTPLYSLVFVLVSIVTFSLKVLVLIYFFMWVRWTLPRYRYDQLMDLGWKWLIPSALANIVVTAALYLIALDERQGGLFGFTRVTERAGLVINTSPPVVGYLGLVGLSFLVAVPATWWVLAKINRTTQDFNLHAHRQLQIRLRAERLAAAGKADAT